MTYGHDPDVGLSVPPKSSTTCHVAAPRCYHNPVSRPFVFRVCMLQPGMRVIPPLQEHSPGPTCSGCVRACSADPMVMSTRILGRRTVPFHISVFLAAPRMVLPQDPRTHEPCRAPVHETRFVPGSPAETTNTRRPGSYRGTPRR